DTQHLDPSEKISDCYVLAFGVVEVRIAGPVRGRRTLPRRNREVQIGRPELPQEGRAVSLLADSRAQGAHHFIPRGDLDRTRLVEDVVGEGLGEPVKEAEDLGGREARRETEVQADLERLPTALMVGPDRVDLHREGVARILASL